MKNRSTKLLGMFVTALTLASCGGGGGSGGGSGPTTPPPPTNFAPTFSASAPAEVVFEDRVIEIRVRGTNDPESDTVNFQIAQVSGPAATLLTDLAGDEPTYYFRAPLLAAAGATADLTFEVSGTDNVNSAVVRPVTVTVKDNELPGLPVAEIEPDEVFFAEAYGPFQNRNPTARVLLLSPDGANADIGQFVEGIFDSFGSYKEPEGSIQFHPDDIVLHEPLPDVGIRRSGGYDLMVLSGDRDALEWYTNDEVLDSDGFFIGTQMVLQQSETFADPCALAERTDTGTDVVWVGLRGGGAVLTEVNLLVDGSGTLTGFEQTRVQTVGAGRSLCFLYPTRLAARFTIGNTGPTSLGLIALDFANKELVLIGDPEFDGVWEELEVVPLDLAGNPNLEIVDVLSQGGPMQAPRYLAVLVSDGIEGGDHRLIKVGQNDLDWEVFQETYQWSGGPPFKLLRGPFAGDATLGFDAAANQFRQDLAVVSASANGSIILRYNNPGSDGSSVIPIFAPAEPLEFPEGATSAIATTYFLDGADPDSYAHFGIIATFPADRSVRFFGLNDE